jgi:nucleotidyltransferase substrate binding protein (TIGR01987 family)
LGLSPSTLEFSKAVRKLEDALQQKKNEFIRDSVIQRFEFSIELARKTARKLMGTSTSAPKDVIREMAQNQYIKNVDLWLKAIDMRNLSAHTYKEDLAEQVYAFAQTFIDDLKDLTKLFESK